MEIDLRSDCGAVGFEELAKLIRAAGLTPHTAEEYGKAFRNSHTAVFAYDGGRLVGCGRALSDGALQAAVYDIAVLPEYQGIGIGRRIVTAILERTKGCGCILFANPGKEPFSQAEFRLAENGNGPVPGHGIHAQTRISGIKRSHSFRRYGGRNGYGSQSVEKYSYFHTAQTVRNMILRSPHTEIWRRYSRLYRIFSGRIRSM